ncbi:MAG: prenyltransferase/squalene oxidase repeat-containing protein [Chthonomonadales bacterium]
MRLIAAMALFGLPLLASAPEVRPKAANVNSTITRGLSFLAKDAMAWKKDHNCVSCHHAGLVIWSMREAKLRGHAVDEPVLWELTNWVNETAYGTTVEPMPAGQPKKLSAGSAWFALGFQADPRPDAASQQELKLILSAMESQQTETGGWLSWPQTRPPFFGESDDTMTALATLTVLSPAAKGDAMAKTARDKGVKWLAETKTDDDPQSIALRLIVWKRLGRPKAEWMPLVQRIKERQNEDGGWSQEKDMSSDAWATGQALYALANAGVRPREAAISRAQDFLMKTQREDGSWPMTSRQRARGGARATNLIPITAAGSAWAVLGLVRSR